MIEPTPQPSGPEPVDPAPLPFTVAWVVFGLLVFLLVGGTAQTLQLAWGLWFSELIIFAGLAVLGWQVLRIAPLRITGLDQLEPRSVGLGLAFGVLNYFAWAVPLMALAQAVFPKSVVEQFDGSQIFARQTPVELALVLVSVSVAAPLGEELFFRGFMQRALGQHQGAARAIVVTAFVFSAFHLDPVGLAARFELGVLFGLLAWRSGSLWPAMAAHAANNALSSALFFAAGEAKEADLVWWVPAVMFLVGNAALIALVRSSGGLRVTNPMRFEFTRATPWPQLVWPWALGAIAFLAALFLLDARGVQLNLIDAKLRPPKELKQRADVKELRAKARRGEAPVDDYEAALK